MFLRNFYQVLRVFDSRLLKLQKLQSIYYLRRLLDLNRLLLSLGAQVSVLSSFTERAKTVTLLYGKNSRTPHFDVADR